MFGGFDFSNSYETGGTATDTVDLVAIVATLIASNRIVNAALLQKFFEIL